MNAFRIRQLLGSATAILLLAVVVAEPVQAQQGTVAGQVTDKSNQQPVPGASVLIVGTSLQGRTSREGRYTVTNLPPGRYNVQVRLIGYATATQPVTVASGQTATVDFILTPAAVPLDAVIVSATGAEQLKRELGNTVGTIDAAKITQDAAPSNASDLLNSRIPGVEVMQSGGTTGTGSRIRIRGATSLSLRNEPIIVVDGVRVDNTPRSRSKPPETKNVVISLPPAALTSYCCRTPWRNGEFCTSGLKLSTPTMVQMPRACDDSRHDAPLACREK